MKLLCFILFTDQKKLRKFFFFLEFSEINKDSSDDPFLKLDSLYNGTISEDQLGVDRPGDELNLHEKSKVLSSIEDDRLSPSELMNSNGLEPKIEVGSSENELNFDSDSMVVARQPKIDSLGRYVIKS